MTDWQTADFDFTLPSSRIAQYPAPRGESRLLVLGEPTSGRHARIRDLPSLLRPGDLVVVNDTRVLPARLFARRSGGEGRVELLLVEKLSELQWMVLLRPARRVRLGTRLTFEDGLEAEVEPQRLAGRHCVRFDEPVEGHLSRLGHVPLPPYIKRPDEPQDRQLYQTVFARQPGAIAAPTAGLHFDQALLAELPRRGVEQIAITLHVGIGTFKPVTAERISDHRMEPERYLIPKAAVDGIERCRARGGRVVAVGTTVVRALEAAALQADGKVKAGESVTNLFIAPGFRFQVVDLLLTNFHLPRSTLLMLVCAFAGRELVLSAYREAIAEGYRFYSYGDAMLASRL